MTVFCFAQNENNCPPCTAVSHLRLDAAAGHYNFILATMLNVKGCLLLFMGTYLRAVERHLPHGITQCYLPPDTGERAPH